MDPRQAIQLAIDSSHMVSMAYLDDMTDDELMHRPHPGCNHIKWQLGHLIASEHQMIEGVAPDSMPSLPEGFVERYTKETAASDDAGGFDTKAELMRLFEEQRSATLSTLAGQSDADLDAASPESMQAYAPTVGAAFSLQGGHWLMHAGQWAVIRRQLGRPPLF